ncbi:MAG TPA: glycosyltransferase [Amycolatopsis sp.]|nr:glycosyltransferase [Amycolatopsis sp.]
MRALIISQGSRGDIQPFVALADALRSAGHEVLLIIPETFSQLAASYNVAHATIFDVTKEILTDKSAGKAISAGNNGVANLFRQGFLHRKYMPRALEDMASIKLEKPDVLLHNHTIPGNEIADLFSIPHIPVAVTPILIPTSTFPSPWFPLPCPSFLNRASYMASGPTLRYYIGNTSKWRTEILGLPKRRGHRDFMRNRDGSRAPVLQPVSRHLLPQDTAYPSWAHTTGFWNAPHIGEWKPGDELLQFVDSEEPPVYIGFGSLNVVTDIRRRRAEVCEEAARLAGVRAVIYTNLDYSERKLSDDQIFHLDRDVQFDWLFPRVSAIVHHGGCGTVGASLMSGKPQVICPAYFEQHLNGQLLHDRDVAPLPLPSRKMTPRRLADAIRQATDDRSKARSAEELARKVSTEDGLGAAVRLLESIV